jgi:hypothetical protein
MEKLVAPYVNQQWFLIFFLIRYQLWASQGGSYIKSQ